MLRIRFTPPHDLELSGSVHDLEILRSRLIEAIAAGKDRIMTTCDLSGNPAPFAQFLGSLAFVIGTGPAQVAINANNGVIISGDVSNLKRFASFLYFQPDSPSGSHNHYEFVKGLDYVSRNSIPMVIGIE